MSGTQNQITIASFTSDITNAPPPPLLPPRSYRAELMGAAIRPVASNPNHLMWNLTFRVPPEEYPADYDGDPEGTIIYYSRARAEDSMRGRHDTRKLMEKIGGPLSMRIDCNELIGLWANVEVVHSTFNDETRAQVARVLAP